MNAFQLTGTASDGTVRGIWCCDKCKQMNHDKASAVRCCDWKCSSCGAHTKNFIMTCDDCNRKKWRAKEQATIDKAEKLDDWADGVFWNDNYYSSVEDALEAMDCQCESLDDYPEYVFVAQPCPPRKVGAGWIYEHICDDLDLDDRNPEDCLQGTKEFELAIDAFNEANKAIQWFQEDRTRMVRVPKPAEVLP